MSWKEDVTEKSLVIRTGDGREWTFAYKNPKYSVDMNAVALQYNDVPGADVKRGEIGYREFPMLMFFQGDNHLAETSRFIESSADRRAWQMEHPYYGTVICQPSSIDVNNDGDNVSEISVTLYETIEDIDTFQIDNRFLAEELIEESLEESIAESDSISANAEESALIGSVGTSAGEDIRKKAVTDIDFSNINESIYSFNAKLNTIGSNPVQIMRQLASILRAPAKFYDTITNRIDVIIESYEDLKASVRGLQSFAMKIFFEKAGAMSVLAAVEAALNPKTLIASEQGISEDIPDELTTRKEVLEMIERLKSFQDDYISEVNSYQSDVDNKLDSYYPDYSTINKTKKATSKAIGNLLSIANNAKVERYHYINEDTPLLILVHRLYGTYDNDTVQKFIQQNSIPSMERLVVKGGRTLIYYV